MKNTLFAMIAVVGLLSQVSAHDAIPTAAMPEGWSYPTMCCSNYDCRHIEDGSVKESPEGYVVPSGEVIPMTDSRVRESPDGMFHWCTTAGLDTGHTICLFVPPRSF